MNIIKDYFDNLTAIGQKYGYLPKPTKSYQRKTLMVRQNVFTNSIVNITAEGKRYLGAIIESTKCRDEYVKDLVKDWDNQQT